MKNIAIIPARSGSKGLKDKNIKLLNGKPLLAYSVEAALESKIFDEVMVSTDSEKYAAIARDYGANVPFLRSAELSSDTASSKDVILDVLNRYEASGKIFDTFCLLQPTSPLRTASDIIKAYEYFSEKDALAVVGVTEADHSPLIYGTLPEDRSMVGFIKDGIKDKPRQALETYYRINGAMYIASVEYYREFCDFYKDRCYAYVMGREVSVDIDSELDFELASVIYNKKDHNGQYNNYIY